LFQNYFDFVSNWLFKILFIKDIISIQSNIKYESNFTEIIAILLKWWQIFLRKTRSDAKDGLIQITFGSCSSQQEKNLIFREKFHFTLCIKLWWWWRIKCELQQFMQNKFQQFIPHYLKNCFHSHQLQQEFTNWAEKTCSICFCFYYIIRYSGCHLMWSRLILLVR
jgi:hypothetical protein